MMRRAFTLLEVMVTIAILGIIAALAVPILLPEVHHAQLNGATELAANFLWRARAEAMTSKRCVEIALVAGPPTKITMARFNSFDCDTTGTPAAPFIDTASAALPITETLVADNKGIVFSFKQVPAQPGGTRFRIRPSGRVFGTNTNLTDDDFVLRVSHNKLPATDSRDVLYDGNGLICTLPRGRQLNGAPGTNFTCPGA